MQVKKEFRNKDIICDWSKQEFFFVILIQI